MHKEFIPYEQALSLKELGFEKDCLGWYSKDGSFYEGKMTVHQGLLLAPLYQQAFNWFLDNYGLFAETTLWGDGIGYMSSVKEIRQEEFKVVYDLGLATPNRGLPNWDRNLESLACLKKIIEIVKSRGSLDTDKWRVLVNPIEREDFLLSISSRFPEDIETTEERYRETYSTEYGTYEVIWEADNKQPTVRKLIK